MYSVIKLENLIKNYKNLIAVNNLSLEIQKGGVVGFIGPNGAGKTTTLKLIAKLIKPNSGKIYIADKNGKLQNLFEKNKKNLDEMGFLIDIPHFYNTTPYRLLKYITGIRNFPKKERNQRIDELLKLFNLYERKYDKIKNFSKGMKQLLGFIVAIINEPEIIILDEPQTGLDPNARILIRKYIKSLQRQGKTIFIASHMLYEISEVCDKLALINHGELLGFDKIENFENKLESKEIICKITNPINPKKINNLIETISQHLKPYLDNKMKIETSEDPITYNQQEKSFTIYYDGKRDSKTEILNILFNKFKSDFSIHSFTESKTAQLENLYSQMIKEKKEK